MEGPEQLAAGIPFPEGLAWSPDDGCLLCTSVQEGAVHRIWPEQRRREKLADVGGGANNLVLAYDGGAVVCQNGGIDAGPPMSARYPDMPALPPIGTAAPGLMHVSPDGESRYLVDEGVNAPNDIAATTDGALVFTDPGNPFLTPRPAPRLMQYSASGDLRVLADGFEYCNGVFVDGENVLVTDHGGVLRFHPDGSRTWAIRYDDGNVDGLALDAEGGLYVARQARGGVDVVQDGEVVEFLALPAPAMATNACFGGPDDSWLFITDARQGAVYVFENMPTRGASVAAWAPPQPVDGRST